MAEKKKRGLGKGLDSLIPVSSSAGSTKVSVKNTSSVKKEESGSSEIKGLGTVQVVRIASIEPDKSQPRKNFDKDKLLELAESIKEHGLIEPLIVQKNGDRYTLVAGERRWRASKQAGLKEVPVIVREFDEMKKAMIALIDNLQREDLNPIEEAEAFKSLIDDFGFTQEELASKVSKSRSAVTNSLRLLKLAESVRRQVASGLISMGHARALVPVENEEQQIEIADKIIKEDLSVRETEKLIKNLGNKKAEKKESDKSLEMIYKDLQIKMNESLGMKVNIKAKGKGGKLEITYANQSDLEKLMDLLM